MDVVKLKARLRTGTGKSYTHKILSQGWIPAVYYGHNRKTKKIEVDSTEFASIVRLKKTTHLVELDLPGKKDDSVTIIKEIQKNILKDGLFYHVDFQHVAMDEKVTVQCPILITGTAIGVREESGILGHSVHSVTIECLPADIPENITVDVSDLHIGDAIHVKDIEVPKVIIKNSPEEVIASVVQPQAVVEEHAVTEEAEEGVEEKAEEEVKEDTKTKIKEADAKDTKTEDSSMDKKEKAGSRKK